jgi:hypothetical protein
MLAVCTPSPICTGLRPPASPIGPLAKRRVWLIESANVAREDLKPGVLALARLLPITSIQFWCACRPLRAVVREVVMDSVV